MEKLNTYSLYKILRALRTKRVVVDETVSKDTIMALLYRGFKVTQIKNGLEVQYA